MFISVRISLRVKDPEPRMSGEGRPISVSGLVLEDMLEDMH